jgi:purine-binding chemotaxis protein CheW
MMTSTSDDVRQLLVFELAGIRLALELACVREVVRAVFITPLPGAPLVVEGVISVRGDVVPVYDLRARFGLPARRLHPDEVIVIAWTGTRRAGIRCERTEWLTAASRDSLEPAPEFRDASNTLITGVARTDDGLILIHDLRAFLDSAESDALEHALQQHGSSAATDGSAEPS